MVTRASISVCVRSRTSSSPEGVKWPWPGRHQVVWRALNVREATDYEEGIGQQQGCRAPGAHRVAKKPKSGGTSSGQDGAEFSGGHRAAKRAPSHHHVFLDKP